MGRKTPWSFFFSPSSYLAALKTGKKQSAWWSLETKEKGAAKCLNPKKTRWVGEFQVFFLSFRVVLFFSLLHGEVQRVTALLRATQLVFRLLFFGVWVTEERHFGRSSCCSASLQTAQAVAVAAAAVTATSTLLVAVHGTAAWQSIVCVAHTCIQPLC